MTIGMCHLGGILNIFIVNWNKYRNYWFATGRMIHSMTNSPSAAVSRKCLECLRDGTFRLSLLPQTILSSNECNNQTKNAHISTLVSWLGRVLVPEGIIHPVVSVLTLTWFIRCIHYRNLKFLHNAIINKNVLLRHWLSCWSHFISYLQKFKMRNPRAQPVPWGQNGWNKKLTRHQKANLSNKRWNAKLIS
jgi:hypothetical protein